jgi:hypothetical protein
MAESLKRGMAAALNRTDKKLSQKALSLNRPKNPERVAPPISLPLFRVFYIP